MSAEIQTLIRKKRDRLTEIERDAELVRAEIAALEEADAAIRGAKETHDSIIALLDEDTTPRRYRRGPRAAVLS